MYALTRTCLRTSHGGLSRYIAPAILHSRLRLLAPYSTEPAKSTSSTAHNDIPLVSLNNKPTNQVKQSPVVPVSEPAETRVVAEEKEATPTRAVEKSDTPKGSRWSRIKAVVKKEALHYWHGTKLLAKEVRISSGLLVALLKGRKLTRREHRQLKRTTQDLLRLLPFSVFVIVPFMEFLLPVALKLFPNMLPSTFTDKHKEDEAKRKLLRVRIEMAKFLQETLREGGVKSPDKIKNSEEFQEFFRKVRATGESPSTDDIVRVAKLFDDDLTLENLSRPQLVSMCRYMNINAFGTDNFLRHTIRNRLDYIRKDDKVIEAEGIDALQDSELSSACQARGIRTMGVPPEKLREHLAQWIDMHLHRGLSGTLLILSKAFAYSNITMSGKEDEVTLTSLKDTLASLPDSLLNVTELQVAADKKDFKKRLEVIQEQEELIEDEKEQEAKEATARQAQKAKEQEERELTEEAEKKKAEADKEKAEQALPQEQVDAAEPSEDEIKNVRMTQEQVNELGSALSILSAKSSVLQERADLDMLMKEHAEALKDKDLEEDPNAAALGKKIHAMIEKIDEQLKQYDEEAGAKMNTISLREDGKISVEDLRKTLAEIQHRPDEAHIDVLINKLDVDGDGFVPLSDIVSLAEGEGLGVMLDDAESLLSEGKSLRNSDLANPGRPATKPEAKLKKEDVVADD